MVGYGSNVHSPANYRRSGDHGTLYNGDLPSIAPKMVYDAHVNGKDDVRHIQSAEGVVRHVQHAEGVTRHVQHAGGVIRPVQNAEGVIRRRPKVNSSHFRSGSDKPDIEATPQFDSET